MSALPEPLSPRSSRGVRFGCRSECRSRTRCSCGSDGSHHRTQTLQERHHVGFAEGVFEERDSRLRTEHPHLGRCAKWRRLCRSRWHSRTSVGCRRRLRLARRGSARGFGSLRNGEWRGRRGMLRRPCGVCFARGAFGGGERRAERGGQRGAGSDLRISCEVLDVAGLFLAGSERRAEGGGERP